MYLYPLVKAGEDKSGLNLPKPYFTKVSDTQYETPKWQWKDEVKKTCSCIVFFPQLVSFVTMERKCFTVYPSPEQVFIAQLCVHWRSKFLNIQNKRQRPEHLKGYIFVLTGKSGHSWARPLSPSGSSSWFGLQCAEA